MTPEGVDGDRVVQVVALDGGSGGDARLGSGYLIGADLVLTAAHVVHRAREVVVRRVLGRTRDAEAGAQVVWIDPDLLVDVAVLRLAPGAGESGAFPMNLARVGFGRVEGLVECGAVGFPLFMLRRDAPGPQAGGRLVFRDTHHALGSVTAISGRYGGTLEVQVPAPREDPDPSVSPWEGMSGAAVFAGGVVVGVVCAHHRAEGAGRITARRVEAWYDLAPTVLAELRDLLGLPPKMSDLAVVRGDGVWDACPYLGLMSYTSLDAQVFYGREELTQRLYRKVVIERAGGGWIVVTGPSGAGKSSLIRAGLAPALERRASAQAVRQWPCRVMVPGAHPMRELAVTLSGVTGRPVEEVAEVLDVDPSRAGALVAAALARRVSYGREVDALPHFVLVVDQFETLMAAAADEPGASGQQSAFLAAVHSLTVAHPDWPEIGTGVVVAVVRGDFVDQMLGFEPLAAAYESGPFVVRPMTQMELSQAMIGPAVEAGLVVDSDLVEQVLADVRGRTDVQFPGGGVLPLVSQVMARTWEKREDNRLTVRAYRRAGGLADAVNQEAEEVYERLDPVLREVARAVFLRLTLVSGDGQVIRCVVGRDELRRRVVGTAGQVDEVLERFVRRRLVVTAVGDQVQVAHEMLLKAWARLHGWLEGDRGDHAAFGQLIIDADTWWHRGQDPAYLYPGSRLAEITTMRARWDANPQRYPSLSDTATQFVAAAYGAEQHRASRRRRLIVGLAVLALTASGMAVSAVFAANRAQSEALAVRAQSAEAVSRQLATEALALNPTAPIIARQLAVAAEHVSPTAQAFQAEATLLAEQQYTLIASDQQVNAVAFNSSGTLLATADMDGTVKLWNPNTKQQIGTTITTGLTTDGVVGMAFNSAGNLLATVDMDGIVKLWNPNNHHQTGTIATGSTTIISGIHGVAFNSSGTLLATAESDGTVKLWNPTTHRQIGTTITAAPTVTTPTGASTYGVSGVAFNPSGTLLATADGDGTVKLWNPTTHRQIGTTITATTAIYGVVGVAFNSAGTLLATVDGDGTVKLWDSTTHRQIGTTITATTVTPFFGGVDGVAFNSSGTLLATADTDGTVKLWDPTTQRQAANPPITTFTVTNGITVIAGTPPTASTTTSGVDGVAFNSSGTLLATADADGTVKLWDSTTHHQIGTTITATTVTPFSGGVDGVAFNSSGTLLATADGDGTVKLWDSTTHRQIGTTITANTTASTTFPSHPNLGGVAGTVLGGVAGVAFNSSGTLLATADADGTVKLWNPITQQQIGTTISAIAGYDGVAGVAFNSAGTLLASADTDGTVKLWDPSTHHQIGTTITAAPGVVGVAFNSAGTLLATAGTDGTVKLWDPSTHHQIGTTITATATLVTSAYGVAGVAFNSAGTLLASADTDGTVKLWSPTTQQQIGTTITVIGVDGVAFNLPGTLLATADTNGSSALIDVSRQNRPDTLLCQEFGLPSASAWSQYAEGAFAEPSAC
jgi:WD40 repeat protein